MDSINTARQRLEQSLTRSQYDPYAALLPFRDAMEDLHCVCVMVIKPSKIGQNVLLSGVSLGASK